MSGASNAMWDAAAFQISMTFQLGPPLAEYCASDSLNGLLREAFTYIGRLSSACPAAAISSTKRPVYQALNAWSAFAPNACDQVPPLRVARASEEGMAWANRRWAS